MKLIAASLAGAAIVLFAAFWFMPGGALAMGCAGQYLATSYYGLESCHATPCRTASGEIFTGRDMTAASRTLPFQTRLRVSYKGKSVVVRITDRGPARWTGRELDLSLAAAQFLGMIQVGHAKVCVERLT